MALTKEQIVGISDIIIDELYIPEWDGTVYVKTMTAAERDKFEESVYVREGTKRVADYIGMRAKLCSIVLCDEKGNRLFTDKEVEILEKKDAKAILRIFEKATLLSALGREAAEEAKKNLSGDQKDDSYSS